VANNPELLSLIVRAAKKKGIRLDVASLAAPESEYPNKNVVLFQGRLCHLLDRIFEGFPSLITGHQIKRCHKLKAMQNPTRPNAV
jgi:hypothetical protein